MVSYAISNLEQQLDVSLFDRTASKRARLTDIGRAVLEDAKDAAAAIDGLRARIRTLKSGEEPEISVAIDAMLPAQCVVNALVGFREVHPGVAVNLRMEACGGVVRSILSESATVGICGSHDANVEGIERWDLGGLPMLPVAIPGHPLASAGQRPGQGRKHLQIVLRGRSEPSNAVDAGQLGKSMWGSNDMASKHLLVLAGVGWGNLPEPLVRGDLATGRLARLDLPDIRPVAYPMSAIYRADAPPGPAAVFLLQQFGKKLRS